MALLTTRIPPSYSPTPFPSHTPRPQPKGVLKAHIKSRHRQQNHHTLSDPYTPHNTEPTLVDRFFSLPPELRTKIYHHLLVRANKFNLPHQSPCHIPLPYTRPGPSPTLSPRSFYTSSSNCASCNPWPRVPQIHTFTSPARSSWATTPQLNPYLCDNCYWDVYGRHAGDPCLRSLPCLCARRTELAVLLVNKRFYEEAGPVFWGSNVWAFEHPVLLAGFLEALSPRTRGWLRRVCFMPIHGAIGVRDWTGDGDVGDSESRRVFGWRDMKRCWNLLRLCEGLVELELDVVFLRKVEWALLIRMIRVKKVVVFSRHPGLEEVEERRQEEPGDGEEVEWIWWSHANRLRVQTETVDLLVKSMLSERAGKSKTVKRHFAETSVMQRWGGDIYPHEA